MKSFHFIEDKPPKGFAGALFVVFLWLFVGFCLGYIAAALTMAAFLPTLKASWIQSWAFLTFQGLITVYFAGLPFLWLASKHRRTEPYGVFIHRHFAFALAAFMVSFAIARTAYWLLEPEGNIDTISLYFLAVPVSTAITILLKTIHRRLRK
jgi:hypothetical protein